MLKAFGFLGPLAGDNGEYGYCGEPGESLSIPSLPIIPRFLTQSPREALLTFQFSPFTFHLKQNIQSYTTPDVLFGDVAPYHKKFTRNLQKITCRGLRRTLYRVWQVTEEIKPSPLLDLVYGYGAIRVCRT